MTCYKEEKIISPKHLTGQPPKATTTVHTGRCSPRRPQTALHTHFPNNTQPTKYTREASVTKATSTVKTSEYIFRCFY